MKKFTKNIQKMIETRAIRKLPATDEPQKPSKSLEYRNEEKLVR